MWALPTGCAPQSGGRPALPFAGFSFAHYSSGGTAEQCPAIILFEQSVSAFTAYQVAFISCAGREALANYYSVCYVELLNNKPAAGQAAIRAISFGDNRGLYGDSNPNYYRHDYTQAYMDEHFVQRLVRSTKDEFDAWAGYGSQLAAVEVDAVTGATVTTANVTSMLKSLFAYHTEKYYSRQ
ncbi:MAG: FMN-binding protein [Gracilibacteraceae bacterium]|jgi:hypothetical protein|nr:FMN-binding protein [Gracilibacteraceae bacterium]